MLEQEEYSLLQYVEAAVVKELLQKEQLEQALNGIGNMEGMTVDLFFPIITLPGKFTS